MSQIKQKTAQGFAYKFAERAGAQGIGFIVQIILARLLIPEDYGFAALIIVLITICDVFVTYGFGNSLIANKNSDDVDFSTCFYFGLAISILFYIIMFSGAPAIAKFYKNDSLTPVIRVMSLRLPIAAINSVQHAYVSKKMWFRKFFYATLTGTIISGIASIIMAYAGLGIWALVVQYLGNALIDTICLWFIVKWRPQKLFSFERLRVIYQYGWKILAVGLIDTLYVEVRSLIIGKKYSSESLAFYNRGYTFPAFSMKLVEPTINTVLFPALAQCQDDQKQMREISRTVTMVCSYIISPIMVGLAVIAKPLVIVLLGEKWLPCSIYIQIGCLANVFRPSQVINTCILKASGNSKLLLKLDVIKKMIGLLILLISMNYGVIWIAFSLVAFYIISTIINIAPNRRILNYGYRDQCLDLARNLIPAIFMGIAVYTISFANINTTMILVLQIVSGIIFYLIISVIIKCESYQIIKTYIIRMKNQN